MKRLYGCWRRAHRARCLRLIDWCLCAAAVKKRRRSPCSTLVPVFARRSVRSTTGRYTRAAERNDTKALEAMLACGFDPDRGDESIGKTALHAAAMEGWPDAVRMLLAHGASVTVRAIGSSRLQPLIWAAEGSRTSRRGQRPCGSGTVVA